MRAMVVPLLAAMLGGCAAGDGQRGTERGYAKALDTWVNFPEQNLVRHWGPPHRVYETGGSKFLTWIDSSSVVLPGIPPSYVTSRVGRTTFVDPVGGMDPEVVNYRCETTFEVRDEIIRNWRFRGNACIAAEEGGR